MTRQLHKIDAEGKILGRLASQIAVLLRGKNKPDFEPHIDAGDIVQVVNFDKIKVSGKKLMQKKYFHYSGYPGGIKQVGLQKMLEDNPQQVLKKAVYNMLPKNKLRDNMIKRLQFIK